MIHFADTDFQPGAALARLRAETPLVHCITNFVAMQIAANVLLAAGASPAMLHAPEEVGDFTPLCAALTINFGTPSVMWVEGMLGAAEAARTAGKPWVLDPVAVGATPFRQDAAARLLAYRPTLIRGNASEILALAGQAASGRGADSGDTVEAAEAAARALARQTGAIVAVTGAVDLVTDGKRQARIANGHPLMTKVTALGCALTCLLGGFLATTEDAFAATVGGLAYYGLAGDRAATEAAGPGSFAVAFVDALAALTPHDVDAGARITG